MTSSFIFWMNCLCNDLENDFFREEYFRNIFVIKFDFTNKKNVIYFIITLVTKVFCFYYIEVGMTAAAAAAAAAVDVKLL